MSLVTANVIAPTTPRPDGRPPQRSTGGTFPGLFASLAPPEPSPAKAPLPVAGPASPPSAPATADNASGRSEPVPRGAAGTETDAWGGATPPIPHRATIDTEPHPVKPNPKLGKVQGGADREIVQGSKQTDRADSPIESNGGQAGRRPMGPEPIAAASTGLEAPPPPPMIAARPSTLRQAHLAGSAVAGDPILADLSSAPIEKRRQDGVAEQADASTNTVTTRTGDAGTIAAMSMIAGVRAPSSEAGQLLVSRASRAKAPIGGADARLASTTSVPLGTVTRDGVSPFDRPAPLASAGIALDEPAASWAPELARSIGTLGGADSPSRTARLKLHPEALGEIDVSVELRQDRLSATLVMSSPSAHAVVAAASDTLERAVAAAGLHLDQLHLASGHGGGRSSADNAGDHSKENPRLDAGIASLARVGAPPSSGATSVDASATGHVGAVDVHA